MHAASGWLCFDLYMIKAQIDRAYHSDPLDEELHHDGRARQAMASHNRMIFMLFVVASTSGPPPVAGYREKTKEYPNFVRRRHPERIGLGLEFLLSADARSE